MKIFLQTFLFLTFTIFSTSVYSQTTGDYRSAATGNWSTLASWERWSGSAWVTPNSGQGYPGQSANPNTVTIQAAHAITVDVAPASTIGSTTFTVNGTANINNNIVITNKGDFTVNGTVNFNSTAVVSGGGGGANAVPFTLTSTGTLKTANTSGITSSGLTGSIQVNSTRTYNTAAQYEYNGSAAQVTGNGLPNLTSGGSLTISNTSATVTMSAAKTFASGSTTTINASATLATGAFTFTNSGATNVNGTFQISQGGFASGANFTYAGSGTLSFAHSTGTYAINSTDVYWPSTNSPINVTVVSNAINFGNGGTAMSRTVSGVFQTSAGVSITQSSGSSVLTISGTCQINTGGFFNNSPTYSGTGSTLVYNTTGSFTISNEWNGAGPTVGAGVPRNVTVQNSTALTINGARSLGGTLNISTTTASAILSAAYTGASSIAGTIQLNNGGTVSAAPTYSGTSSALIYNEGTSLNTSNEWSGTGATVGSGVPQNVTVTNNSTVTTAGNRGLSGTLAVSSGSKIILVGSYIGISSILGTLQLNSGGSVASAPNYSGTGSALIYNQSSSVTNGSEWNSTSATVGSGVPQNVTIQNNTIVTTSANRALTGTLTVASGSVIALGAGYTSASATSSISGRLQLNSGGSVTSAPTYVGTSSGLIYNSTFSVGAEWNSTSATVGVGVPQNVTVQNNSTLTTSANRALTGTLNVAIGSTIVLGAGYTAGSTSISGTLQINTGGFSSTTVTYSGSSSNLIYNTGASFTNSNEWNSTSATVGAGVPQNVTVQGGTTLSTSANRALTGTLTVASGATIAIGAGYTAGSSSIAGTLQINNGGFSTPTITYSGTSATLVYNSGGSYSSGNEWNGNGTTAGAGIPQNVTIQNTTTVNMPSSDRGLAGNLNISSGTLILNATSGNLFLGGSWTRSTSGTFTPNNRIVTFNGATSPVTITAPNSGSKDANGSFGGETFSFLTIDKSAKANTVTLGGNLCITKTMTLTRGTFDPTASDVVLASNATTTADIAAINTTNADITYSSSGRFIPQRYIGNTSTIRTWRYLTAPLQASDPLTINDAWQEGQVSTDYTNPGATNPYPGFGTHITGPGSAGDNAKGFDQGRGNNGNSLKFFDNSGGVSRYSFPANTKNTKLMSQLGWAIFVRGDRGYTFSDQYTPSGNTILEPKGKINVGDVTSTVTGGGVLFNVVGNPYPCQINMTNVSIGGSTQANFTLWDPKAYTNYTQTGKFIPFTYLFGTTYTSSNSPVTTWANPGTVESGEAFLARASGNTSVVFHESDKVAGTSSLNGIQSRPAQPTNTISLFRVNLGYYPTPSNLQYIDGTLNLFSSSYNTAVDKNEDVISTMSGSTTGAIRITKDGYQLSISKEKSISTDDTIYLNLSSLIQVKHRLALIATDFVPASTALLIDKFANTSTTVSMINNDTTFYDFDITADAQSNRTDRFMVVFKPSGTTPVKFTNVKAAQATGGIAVQWKVESEVNAKSYDVEKSSDGVHFTKVNTTEALNLASTATYNWLDAAPNTGDNYYRIRIVNQSGNVVYSQVIKVRAGLNASGITVLNNSIVNNAINLQFTNQPAGVYKLKLYNAIGQLLDSKEISGTGNSWGETFLVKSNLAKGLYNLEIYTPSNKKVIQKLIAE